MNDFVFLSMSSVKYSYVMSGFIKSTKSPFSVVSLFLFPDVSVAVPASIFIETVPLQSVNSLSLFIVALVSSKSVNSNV